MGYFGWVALQPDIITFLLLGLGPVGQQWRLTKYNQIDHILILVLKIMGSTGTLNAPQSPRCEGSTVSAAGLGEVTLKSSGQRLCSAFILSCCSALASPTSSTLFTDHHDPQLLPPIPSHLTSNFGCSNVVCKLLVRMLDLQTGVFNETNLTHLYFPFSEG